MNRWLTRRKGVVEDQAAVKKPRKGKKGQEEEAKPDFNLDAALPTADDFRTSLIMPGLSTRFSMLREQDDPKSKMGKASDDSVLHPKRQSRLHEFGFIPGGLSDIAEVSSLHGSIRPSFARDRQGSFDSSRDDDGGSVMSRARPGEGNVLFGGRQKIYVISNASKGLGRTLYDDDVNMSAYQKLRQEEKERLREQELEYQDRLYESSSPSELSRKRETSSSTNSGTVETRTSTAATSIASQGANSVPATSPAFPTFNNPTSPLDLSRSTTKARRLYDQGLDQHIQDQQSSAMNRLNSIQRARGPTGRATPPLAFQQARSATNLNDRFNRGQQFRSESPITLTRSAMGRNDSSASSSPVLPPPLSPALTSPVTSDSEDAFALNAALKPHDRGKATALGAFNKPKEAFSEHQYAERLKHMHRKRDIPEAAAPKEEKSAPRKPTLRERAAQEKRRRAEAEVAERPRPHSPLDQSLAASAFSRFQAAASQMRFAGPATPSSAPRQPEPAHQDDSSRGPTFLTSPDVSDDEQPTSKPSVARPAETTRRFENLPVATGPAPSILEHPALRSRNVSEEKIPQLAPQRQGQPTYQSLAPPGAKHPRFTEDDVDSPTLGSEIGGLSGLIRQHLRSVSNVSSNYDGDSSALSPPATMPAGLALQTHDVGLQPRQLDPENVTPAQSAYSQSSPWDFDGLVNSYRDEAGSSGSASFEGGQKARTQASVEPSKAADNDHSELAPKRTHERIASNETEADHEAFRGDLAQRQRVIQENLRARAEGRSTSPAPGGGGGGLKTALNMLRAKSSRESFAVVGHAEAPARTLRKLTLGTNSTNASSTSLAGLHMGDRTRSESPAPRLVLQQSEQDAQRESDNRQRSGTDSSRTGRPTGRSPSITTTSSSTRDRSGSGNSNSRSRSRADTYRDDLQQAMMEGSRNAYPQNTHPSMSGYAANQTPPLPVERPSLDNQARMRPRSNSRTAASNYFESRHLQPIQIGTASGGTSPRLPLPQGKFSPGIPISPRPSPGAFPSQSTPVPPFSANHTPPVSNPTTPSAASFNPSTVQPMIRQGVLRKKSIAKSEISDPVFLSTTSVIDTVNLPSGASLKNGIDLATPPVPPINPMRKRFGFGRPDDQSPYDPAVQQGFDAPRPAYTEPTRTNSSDALHSQTSQPKTRLRKTSSEGHSLHGQAQAQTEDSPALPQVGFVGRNNSPPRPIYTRPIAQQSMDGAMF